MGRTRLCQLSVNGGALQHAVALLSLAPGRGNAFSHTGQRTHHVSVYFAAAICCRACDAKAQTQTAMREDARALQARPTPCFAQVLQLCAGARHVLPHKYECTVAPTDHTLKSQDSAAARMVSFSLSKLNRQLALPVVAVTLLLAGYLRGRLSRKRQLLSQIKGLPGSWPFVGNIGWIKVCAQPKQIDAAECAVFAPFHAWHRSLELCMLQR